VIPFFGLDNTDAVDPEIAQCGDSSTAGAGGTGGASATTGTTTDGAVTTDGATGTTGATASGAGGGMTVSTTTMGGTTVGGTTVGGTTVGGTTVGSTSGVGGAPNASAAANTGALDPVGGASGASAAPSDEGGCSCSVVGEKKSLVPGLPFVLLALFARRRRRGRSATKSRG